MSKKVGVFEPLNSEDEKILSDWVRRRHEERVEITPMTLELDETVLKASQRHGVKITVIPHPYFSPGGRTEALGRRYILLYKGCVFTVESNEEARMWLPKNDGE